MILLGSKMNINLRIHFWIRNARESCAVSYYTQSQIFFHGYEFHLVSTNPFMYLYVQMHFMTRGHLKKYRWSRILFCAHKANQANRAEGAARTNQLWTPRMWTVSRLALWLIWRSSSSHGHANHVESDGPFAARSTHFVAQTNLIRNVKGCDNMYWRNRRVNYSTSTGDLKISDTSTAFELLRLVKLVPGMLVSLFAIFLRFPKFHFHTSQ